MYNDSKKLSLVEALLKEDDDEVLKEIEAMLSKKNSKEVAGKKFSDINALLSAEEAAEFEANIEDGCEQIICN